MRTFLRSTYYTGFVLLFLIIAAVGFTQTKTFRSYLRSTVIANLRTVINGAVDMGPIEGNLLTGFNVKNIVIAFSGDEILSAERLEVRYDPLGFIIHRASIGRVTLLRPRIHLWRSTSGRWNVDQLIIKKGEEDSTASVWVIDLKQLELLNASVLVVDSLTLLQRKTPPPPAAVDYANLSLSPFILRASLRIDGASISATIRNFEATLSHPRFVLRQLSGQLAYTPRGASIQRFALVTERSRLSLDARMDSIDLFRLPQLRALENAPTIVSLNTDRLEFAELKQFLPGPVDFLDKGVSFSLKTSGTFGHLSVDDFTARTSRSFLHLRGTVANLHDPRRLDLSITGPDIVMHPVDAHELLPGLNLPNLRSFGVVNCNVMFDGQPNNFQAAVSGAISAGAFAAEASLDLRQPRMKYDARVKTEGFNLARVLNDDRLASNLSLNATISGAGTDPRTMTALFRAGVDSSEFLSLPVRRSVAILDLAEGTLRSKLLLSAGTTRLDLSGKTHFSADSTTYLVDGTVSSLNLADVLRARRYESDLSFSVRLDGSGFTADRMHTSLQLGFNRSIFGRDTIKTGTVLLEYDTEDSLARTLALNSDAADLLVVGSFTPQHFVNTLEQTASMLSGAVQRRLATLDSLRSPGKERPAISLRSQAAGLGEPIDAKFKLTVKDAYPIGAFLGEHSFGRGSFEGSIQRTNDHIECQGVAMTDRLFLRTTGMNLDLQKTQLKFDLQNIRQVNTLPSLTSSIYLQAEQILYDSVGFSEVEFNHRLSRDSSVFSASALVDSTLGIDIAGTSFFEQDLIHLALSQMKFKVAEYMFENAEPVLLSYGRDGLDIRNLRLQHEAEALEINGVFDPGGISNMQVMMENFLLKNLQGFSRNAAYLERVSGLVGILNLKGSFTGNFRLPSFTMDALAQGVPMGESVFGQVTSKGSYDNGLASLFVEFRTRPEDTHVPPELLISGTMPLKIGSAVSIKATQEMNLTIQSKGFRLAFLDPFIPTMSKLKGTLVCDVRMRGTVASPFYEGTLSIQDSRFLFVPLGIEYVLKGSLVPEGRKITLQGVSISNIEEDRVPGVFDGRGSMNFLGDFTLEGLRVEGFDISANGQLLAMKESERLPGLPLYGSIYAASGPLGLHWRGTPERSLVTGEVHIRNANMTFPPTRDLRIERARIVTVAFIDDTSRVISSEEVLGGRSLALAASGLNGPNPARPAAISLSISPSPAHEEERSFLDNIVYNLAIEITGLTQVRFVFNQLTNEELFADLKGRLVFSHDASSSRLTGELDVGSRSYYRYFKTLQAAGKLLFTGDVTNPELNIVATYEGTYRPDTTRLGLTEDQKLEQKVIVKLEITGSREEPRVKMGLEVYDKDGNKLAQRADAQSDAIAFLVSGTFKDDLTGSQQSSLVSTSLLGSIGSSLLSGPLTELVRNKVGYITSIDVYYYAGANRTLQESADVRITGEVGDAVIRLGGRVLSDITNTNVSVQFPMSSLLRSEAWRNLILELERRVEGVESIEQRRASNGVRLLYRITF